MLLLIARKLIECRPQDKIWCDLPDHDHEEKLHPAWKNLLNNWRPDIIISHTDGALTIVELSCPFEWKNGFVDVHDRKTNKYAQPIAIVRNLYEVTTNCICVEVGSRGLISKNTLKLGSLLDIGPKELRKFYISLGRTSLLASINIYKQRNTMPLGQE